MDLPLITKVFNGPSRFRLVSQRFRASPGPFNEKVWQVGFDSRGLFLGLDSWSLFNLIKKQLRASFRDSLGRFWVLTGHLTSLSIINIIGRLTNFINISTYYWLDLLDYISSACLGGGGGTSIFQLMMSMSAEIMHISDETI